ncbi:unnamed protein product [Meganyctiphanes norvegica]|uniref:Uncharacterized protein n=1 Tax=Meganyctiphanes norvegica TaxID=48144 RepID=A0AAV2R621_MEGNR
MEGHQDQEVQRQNDGGHQDYQDFYDQPGQENDLSARWVNQLNLLRSTKETDLGEMRKIVTALKRELTRKDLQVIIRDIARMEEALKEIKEARMTILQEELVPITQMKDFTREIRDHEKFLTRIQVEAEDKIAEMDKANQPSVPQTPMGAAAQAPMVNLPTFSGKIVEYPSFKSSFKYIIPYVSCTRELWVYHLHNSLKYEVLEYVGPLEHWIDKYEDLWDTLDDKYANRWVVADEPIRHFIGKTVPDSTPEAIDSFFFAQCSALKRVMALEMTVEQVGVNMICQTLPNETASQIRQGLRLLCPNKEQYAFTIKEVRSAYNENVTAHRTTRINNSSHIKKADVQKHPQNKAQCSSVADVQQMPPCITAKQKEDVVGSSRAKVDHICHLKQELVLYVHHGATLPTTAQFTMIP